MVGTSHNVCPRGDAAAFCIFIGLEYIASLVFHSVLTLLGTVFAFPYTHGVWAYSLQCILSIDMNDLFHGKKFVHWCIALCWGELTSHVEPFVLLFFVVIHVSLLTLQTRRARR